MRILVIEDDPDICRLFEDCFESEGFQVETVNDGRLGLERSLERQHDFIILDVRLPGLDGFEVLRRLRKSSDVPVLMLTICNEHADRIRGLESGADDYLNKPFDLHELLARVRAISRRTGKMPGERKPTIISVGDLLLDPGSRRTYRDGEEIFLTAAEFSLLEALVSNAGQVLSREEMVRRVQGRPHNPFDRSIDVHISRLRKKLSHHADGSERIRAVRGVGHYYSLPIDTNNLSN